MHISEGTINTEYAGLGETYTAADNIIFSQQVFFFLQDRLNSESIQEHGFVVKVRLSHLPEFQIWYPRKHLADYEIEKYLCPHKNERKMISSAGEITHWIPKSHLKSSS